MIRRSLLAVALAAFGCSRSPSSTSEMNVAPAVPGTPTPDAGQSGSTADAGQSSSTADGGQSSPLIRETVEDPPRCGVVPPSLTGDVGCGSWVLEQVVPQAHSLRAVWAVSSDDVWAVGDAGAIVHWDGAAWTVAASPTQANLLTVWGADAAHVWAGGQGVLLKFDGSTWQMQPSPTSGSINFISGAAADDVWATGPAARDVYHWDGAQWTQPGAASGAPYILNIGTPIWPGGGERAWAGGCADHVHASLFLWDGSGWSRIDTAVAGCVHAIAGTSPSDVWATAVEYVHGGGSFPTPVNHSLHWDGARWSEVPALPGSFFSPARGEVWVVSGGGSTDGYVYARADGGHFHDFLWLPNIGYTTAMAAAGTADVFIVGEGGLLAHSDGKMIRRFTGPNAGIGSLWAGSGGHAWATVGGSLIRRDNGCWSNVDVGKAAYDQATGMGPLLMWQLSGSGPDDVWATAGTFAVHWDGETFSQHVIPGGGLTGVWVSPSGDALFLSTSGVYRADGSGFTRVLDGSYLSMWAASESDIWLVQQDPAALSSLVHFDGVATTVVGHFPWSDGAPKTISASGDDDVWATVADTVWHFDGSLMTDMRPSPARVYSLAVAARNDVWVSSLDGLWHFDGAWSKADAPPGVLSASDGVVYSLGLGRICRRP